MPDPAPHDPPASDERQVADETPSGVSSTVGTGSILGLGCLAMVMVLVVIAIAFRALGGSW